MAGPTFFAYNSAGTSDAAQTTYGNTAGLLIPIAFGTKHLYAGMNWFPSPDQTIGYVFAKAVFPVYFPDAMHTYAFRNGSSGIPSGGQITSDSGRVFSASTTSYNISKTQKDGVTALFPGDYSVSDPLTVGCYLGTTNPPSYHTYVITQITDVGTHYKVDVTSTGGAVGQADVDGALIFFGGLGTVQFWRSNGLTNQAFVDSVNYLRGSAYTAAQTAAAKSDMESSGYWTTFP